MIIRPPTRFLDCRGLEASASVDAHTSDFSEAGVTLDLRACGLVGPAAVMWCLVYALLAQSRGSKTEVLSPFKPDVAGYLTSVGLPTQLEKVGVAMIEHQASPENNADIILPPDGFWNRHRGEGSD